MMHHPDMPIPVLPGLAGRRIAWARADDFVTQPLKRIFAWWSARAGSDLPRRTDFDILEFADIAQNLYLIEEIAAGFELRLAGEEYIRLFGLKKGWVWRFDSPDPVMRDSARLMQLVAQAGRPIRTIGNLELTARHWIELEALVCPLAPADGAARFLGCSCVLPSAEGR
ncbi:PAS domain-containing protein [Dongia mobilis]|uniref:PAS domain-containing protein n=1 Tax=Dongia mobilis TaxID=578943 RepID=A0A4R6WM04_9PROT|nr:PAS domain-containing protein [Dongia mobilis]TDQ82009.1 PAS domain-containing protein [Dongia mobilis]